MGKESFEKFLEEYRELCNKHGLIVGACGCCDSPWVIDQTSDELDAHFRHLVEGKIL